MAEAKSRAAEADSVESAAPYPKYLDWLRYLSAFLLLVYGSTKLVGRQFHVPPGMALRPVGSLVTMDMS